MNDTLATLEAALVESAIRWYLLWPAELAKPGTLTRAVQDVLAERVSGWRRERGWQDERASNVTQDHR